MSTDHAVVNVSKREALFALLSDGAWHAHHDLADVGGVRYSARLLELRRMGYGIESKDATLDDGSGVTQGKWYRMPSTERGDAQVKRVKVYLDEADVIAMVDRGFIPPAARAALEDAHASFDTNREKL